MSRRSTFSTSTVSILLAIGLLSACSGAPAAPASTSPQAAASAAPSDPGPVPGRPGLPEPLETADPARAAAITAAGYDPVVAEVVARTQVAWRAIDATTVEAIAATPLGPIRYEVRFSREAATDPLRILPAGDASFVFDYAIPADALDAPTRESLEGALALTGGPPIAAGPGAVALGADEARAMVTGWLGDKALDAAKDEAKDFGETFFKHWDQTHPTNYLERYKEALKRGGAAVDAAAAIKSAIEIFQLVDPALSELELLRRCTVEPTDPLTKQSYDRNPEDQRKVLDELEKTRAEIVEYSNVIFSTLILGLGSTLIKEVPFFDKVMEKGVDFVKDSLTGVIAARMAAARGMVTGCGSWRATGEHPLLPKGKAEGTKCGGLEGLWDVFPKQGGVDLRVTIDPPNTQKAFKFSFPSGDDVFRPSESTRQGKWRAASHPFFSGMATLRTGEKGSIVMELFFEGGTEFPWLRPDPPMVIVWERDPTACMP